MGINVYVIYLGTWDQALGWDVVSRPNSRRIILRLSCLLRG